MRNKFGKLLLYMLVISQEVKDVCGCPSVLSLTWEDPIKLGYLKQKPNLFYWLTPPVVRVWCLIVNAQIIWRGREWCSHYLRRMSVKVTASRSATIAKAKSLVSVKLLSQPNIQFLKFFLLNRWTTICYPFHNFVRWVIIVYSPIRVWSSLEEVVVSLPSKVS
jgi:hypothetical protein